MNTYIWQHDIGDEAQRLRLMSEILDPSSRFHIAALPVEPGWRCIEIGAGNGSLSQWLADRVAPGGTVTAADIDTSLMDGLDTDVLDVATLDVVEDGLPESTYDLVCMRALLHHLPQRMDVMATMVRAVRPGGWLFIQEPDFHPVSTLEPGPATELCHDFLRWADCHDIDYFVGRKVAPRLQELGLVNIESEGHVVQYAGGSPYARWWRMGIAEVADQMLAEQATSVERLTRFFESTHDPTSWAMTMSFIAVTGRRPLDS